MSIRCVLTGIACCWVPERAAGLRGYPPLHNANEAAGAGPEEAEAKVAEDGGAEGGELARVLIDQAQQRRERVSRHLRSEAHEQDAEQRPGEIEREEPGAAHSPRPGQDAGDGAGPEEDHQPADPREEALHHANQSQGAPAAQLHPLDRAIPVPRAHLEEEEVEGEAPHPRKYYTLTRAGTKRLDQMKAEWRAFADKIGRLMDAAERPDHAAQ